MSDDKDNQNKAIPLPDRHNPLQRFADGIGVEKEPEEKPKSTLGAIRAWVNNPFGSSKDKKKAARNLEARIAILPEVIHEQDVLAGRDPRINPIKGVEIKARSIRDGYGKKDQRPIVAFSVHAEFGNDRVTLANQRLDLLNKPAQKKGKGSIRSLVDIMLNASEISSGLVEKTTTARRPRAFGTHCNTTYALTKTALDVLVVEAGNSEEFRSTYLPINSNHLVNQIYQAMIGAPGPDGKKREKLTKKAAHQTIKVAVKQLIDQHARLSRLVGDYVEYGTIEDYGEEGHEELGYEPERFAAAEIYPEAVRKVKRERQKRIGSDGVLNTSEAALKEAVERTEREKRIHKGLEAKLKERDKRRIPAIRKSGPAGHQLTDPEFVQVLAGPWAIKAHQGFTRVREDRTRSSDAFVLADYSTGLQSQYKRLLDAASKDLIDAVSIERIVRMILYGGMPSVHVLDRDQREGIMVAAITGTLEFLNEAKQVWGQIRNYLPPEEQGFRNFVQALTDDGKGSKQDQEEQEEVNRQVLKTYLAKNLAGLEDVSTELSRAVQVEYFGASGEPNPEVIESFLDYCLTRDKDTVPSSVVRAFEEIYLGGDRSILQAYTSERLANIHLEKYAYQLTEPRSGVVTSARALKSLLPPLINVYNPDAAGSEGLRELGSNLSLRKIAKKYSTNVRRAAKKRHGTQALKDELAQGRPLSPKDLTGGLDLESVLAFERARQERLDQAAASSSPVEQSESQVESLAYQGAAPQDPGAVQAISVEDHLVAQQASDPGYQAPSSQVQLDDAPIPIKRPPRNMSTQAIMAHLDGMSKNLGTKAGGRDEDLFERPTHKSAGENAADLATRAASSSDSKPAYQPSPVSQEEPHAQLSPETPDQAYQNKSAGSVASQEPESVVRAGGTGLTQGIIDARAVRAEAQRIEDELEAERQRIAREALREGNPQATSGVPFLSAGYDLSAAKSHSGLEEQVQSTSAPVGSTQAVMSAEQVVEYAERELERARERLQREQDAHSQAVSKRDTMALDTTELNDIAYREVLVAQNARIKAQEELIANLAGQVGDLVTALSYARDNPNTDYVLEVRDDQAGARISRRRMGGEPTTSPAQATPRYEPPKTYRADPRYTREARAPSSLEQRARSATTSIDSSEARRLAAEAQQTERTSYTGRAEATTALPADAARALAESLDRGAAPPASQPRHKNPRIRLDDTGEGEPFEERYTPTAQERGGNEITQPIKVDKSYEE